MFANAETFSAPDPRCFEMTGDPRTFARGPKGNGDLHNLHAYVANDPVNFTDPLGLGPDDDDIVVTGHRVGRGGAGGLGGIKTPGGGPTIGTNEAAPATVLPGPPLPGRPSLCLGEDAQGGCAEIVVTARFRADAPFAFDGRRFVLNPYYLKPWYSDYVDYGFALGPPVAAFVAVAGTEIGLFAVAGREIVIRGGRIAPFGNRTGNPFGRWPHYHRRGQGPGQGIGRHRPWEPRHTDTSPWDRF